MYQVVKDDQTNKQKDYADMMKQYQEQTVPQPCPSCHRCPTCGHVTWPGVPFYTQPQISPIWTYDPSNQPVVNT